MQDMQERDKRDQERTTAPLKAAEDAVVIDTSVCPQQPTLLHALNNFRPSENALSTKPKLLRSTFFPCSQYRT